jgi:hypothetical protein
MNDFCLILFCSRAVYLGSWFIIAKGQKQADAASPRALAVLSGKLMVGLSESPESVLSIPAE